MKVIFDHAARGDLDQVHAEIANDNLEAAGSVVDRILEATDRLGRFPSIGHPGRVRGTMEWPVVGLPYVVVYEVLSSRDELVVSGIFHDARQVRRH